MLKYLLLLLCCVTLTLYSFAKNEDGKGAITGTVTTSEGHPAVSVTITLKGTKRGTITDEKGKFVLRNVNEGNHELEISLTGYETLTQSVLVEADKASTVSIVLTLSKKQLEEVIITGGRNKMVDKQTDLVARMPLANLENPQVYNVVGKELLKEQVVTNMQDALKAAPGVVVTSFPSGGVGVVSRGFNTGVGARNGLRSDLNRSSADISNIERIEFIKGPSGTLFGAGASSFGGVVNIVTKRPGENFFGNIGLALGSFGLARVTADINAPVNKEKTVMARVNTAITRQNNFSDFGRVSNFAFAPSVLYKASEKLTILFDAEIFNASSTRPTYTTVNVAKTGYSSFKDLPLGYRRSVYDNDLDAKTQSQKYYVEGRYKINNNWTSTTNLSYVNELTEYSYQTYNTWIGKDSLARYVGIWGPIKMTYINAQQNFVGKFNTGALKHTLLLGVSYTSYYANGEQKGGPNFDTININNTPKLITKVHADKILLQPERVSSRGISNNQYMGAYVSEVLNISDRLYTMLSLRFDRYTQKAGGFSTGGYEQNSLSPKLGLVYQLVKNKVSIFGNYMNGFQNSNPQVEQPDGSILNINPIYANQWEAGIKSELLNGKINATLSYYNINIDNALRNEMINGKQFTRQDGKQQSKGFELDVLANPIAGLNVILGYGYNENKIVKAALNEGNTVAGAPRNIGSYWISYRIQQGALKNFGIGAGGNYVTKSFFDDANTLTIPEYSVVNSTLFYENEKWRVGLKLNNLGNTYYWDSYGNYNPTRNFSVDVGIKF